MEVSRAEVGEGTDKALELDKGLLRCGWVYRNITEGARDGEPAFVEVTSPIKARPGDVVVSRSHIRLVANVEAVEAEGIVFELAESTSARDIPAGQTWEEIDIGPRIIQVKYTKPDQPIVKQTPLKKRLIDGTFKEDKAERAYIIGRYLAFEQFWGSI